MKKFILSSLLILSLVSCTELQKDIAEKSGIKLKQSNELRVRRSLTPGPDSVVAFLWPSEEYFETYQATGLIKVDTYQEFIRDTAADVFLAGDLFDAAILEKLTSGKKLEAEVAKIEELKVPILVEMKAFLAEIKVLKGKEKKLKGEYKKTGKKLKPKKAAIKKETANLKASESSYEAKDCISTPDTSECTTINEAIKNLKNSIKTLNDELAELTAKVKTLKAEMADIKKKQIPAIFAKKKKIERTKLNPLLEAEKEAKLKLEIIFDEKTLRLQEVQVSLDPHSVIVLDDGTIDLNVEQQVNWIKTYTDKASSSNLVSFEKNDQKVNIEFKEWGEDKQKYKTKYEINADGEEVLSKDSDIYDLTFGTDEVLKFKFNEKDARGNATGTVYEFKLQRSNFDVLTRLLGDITVTFRGEVTRRGQMKIILTQK